MNLLHKRRAYHLENVTVMHMDCIKSSQSCEIYKVLQSERNMGEINPRNAVLSMSRGETASLLGAKE